MPIKKLHLSPMILAGLFLVTLSAALVSFLGSGQADFNKNNVMDDVVFQNANTLTAAQIDSFLNSFPSSCISSNNGFLTADPTGWSSTVSTNHGYTFGGNVTAGQAIYDAAQMYHVNPEVILATMQKEQSIVTGSAGCHYTNPSPGEACTYSGGGCVFIGMSYACPGGCDYSYNGFSLQLSASTWLLRFAEERALGKTSGYAGYDTGDSSISYGGAMVNVAYQLSDGNTVTVQSGATAALYYYTPFLSGNENFETIFQSWFGPTIMTDSFFEVINTDPDNGANLWYLITPTGKYYIPSGAVYNAWGLSNYGFSTITTQYFDALPDKGNLGYVLKDQYSNYFFMDDGELHYARDTSYLSLWGLSASSAAQSTGLVYSTNSGNWLGRFAQDASSGQEWLIDGDTKHAIATNSPLLYQWGYTPDQLTSVSSTYLSGLTDGGALSRFVTYGGTDYLVDTDRLITLQSATQQSGFAGSNSFLNLTSSTTLSYMPSVTANFFAQDNTTGVWYFLENGRKHAIGNLSIAEDWGYVYGTALLNVSDDFITSLPDGGALTYLVKDGSGNLWLVDGQKHQIPASQNSDWTTGVSSLPTYSSDSLSLLVTGSPIGNFIRPSNNVYVYEVDGGTKHFISSPGSQQGWGVTSTNTTSLSPNLVSLIPEGAFTSSVVTSAGSAYDLSGSIAYPINATYASDWENTPVSVSAAKLAEYTVSGTSLGDYIKVGSTTYIMSGLAATPINHYADTYQITNPTVIAGLPYGTTTDASYLVGSTDPNDSRMWFVNLGTKILLPSFAEAANYGYVSQGISITRLSPTVLNLIPTSTSPPSLLITIPGAGVKLLSFGYALGFPDGPTLLSYESASNPVLTVAPSVYSQFVLRRSTSRLIRDDSGKIYYMDSGNKRWILNGSLLNTTYSGIPITYLEGTTMVDIPSGSNIN